jgi:hypothetical protein
MPQFLMTLTRHISGTRTCTVLVDAASLREARLRVDALDLEGKLPDGDDDIDDIEGPTFMGAEATPAQVFVPVHATVARDGTVTVIQK